MREPDVALDTVCGQRSDNPNVTDEDRIEFANRMKKLRNDLKTSKRTEGGRMKTLRQLVLDASPDQREFLEKLDDILNVEFSGTETQEFRERLDSALEEAHILEKKYKIERCEYIIKSQLDMEEANLRSSPQSNPDYTTGVIYGLRNALTVLRHTK